MLFAKMGKHHTALQSQNILEKNVNMTGNYVSVFI